VMRNECPTPHAGAQGRAPFWICPLGFVWDSVVLGFAWNLARICIWDVLQDPLSISPLEVEKHSISESGIVVFLPS